jgi:hypothetical protein
MKLRIALFLLVTLSMACAIEKKTTVSLHSEQGDCPPNRACLTVVVLDGSGETFFGAEMLLAGSCLSSPQLPIREPDDGFIHELKSDARFALDPACRNYTISITVDSASNPAEPWYRPVSRAYQVPITLLPGTNTTAIVRLGCYRYNPAFS